jgi:hypothetical protein
VPVARGSREGSQENRKTYAFKLTRKRHELRAIISIIEFNFVPDLSGKRALVSYGWPGLALQLRLARQLIVADVLARFVQLQRLEIPGIGEARQQLQVDQRAVAPAHERSATVVLRPVRA